MRIAVVTTSYPLEPGDAAGHFVESEALQLARAGHEVTVCAPGEPPEDTRIDGSRLRVLRFGASDVFAPPGALPRLQEHPTRILSAAGFMLRVRHWLEVDGPFDSIQAHWLLPCGWPIAIARSSQLEIVCHGSDIDLLLKLPTALQRFIIGQLSKGGVRLRFVSRELRAKLEPIAPALALRGIVEPCAIDTSLAPNRDEARRELALAPESRIALVVGRLIPTKRVDLSLASLAKISKLRTLVIGDGPLRSELGARHPNIEFLGQLSRPETLRWLAAADLLVSASEREGAPTVVREARRLGVPVVAREVGDLGSWAKRDSGIRLFHDSNELDLALGQLTLAPLP